MPTVKLQNGKVLLKDGKVSCTCCDPEPSCCMYPASGLGDSYAEDDLPDAVELTYDFAEGTIMTRDGAQYTEDEFGIYRINRVADGTDDCGESGPKWRLQIKDGDDNWVTDNCTNCLIVPGFVEDQFADCYEISGGTSGTVSRVSLCDWAGIDSEGDPMTLRYLETPYSSMSGLHFWELVATFQDEEMPLELNSYNTINNTPVGSYTDSDGTPGVFTVTEC
jgi:hypothetical protein